MAQVLVIIFRENIPYNSQKCGFYQEFCHTSDSSSKKFRVSNVSNQRPARWLCPSLAMRSTASAEKGWAFGAWFGAMVQAAAPKQFNQEKWKLTYRKMMEIVYKGLELIYFS